jgi:UDP:flavonoid glycosyltransferase YjiC (YdhE family)
MRVLFSAVPAHGHLIPLLPLARAFRSRGHTVGVLTGQDMAPLLEPEGVELLAAGPMPDVLFAEVAQRHGGDTGAANPTPELVAELFAGVRVDLSADEAIEVTGGWRPDLVINEHTDLIGPMVAAATRSPLATTSLGPALPSEFIHAFNALAAPRYAARGLPVPANGVAVGTWYLDTCPPSLQHDGWQGRAQPIPLRPERHRRPGAPATTPVPTEPGARPTVLVTFGTVFTDPTMISPLVRGLSQLDVDVVVTVGLGRDPADFDVDRARVRLIGFTPIDEVLGGVAVVLTHGGVGSVLAALSRGIPLVVVPQGADQFMQAERITSAGVGLALLPGQASADSVAEAARQVLAEATFRIAASRLAAEIASMPTPHEVAVRLEESVGG